MNMRANAVNASNAFLCYGTFAGFEKTIKRIIATIAHPIMKVTRTFQNNKPSNLLICEKYFENLKITVCLPFSSWANFQ